jgi:hypothetical protein
MTGSLRTTVRQEKIVDYKRNSQRALVCAAFTLVSLLGLSQATTAQGSTKTATEKWRPKAGPYASAGADFAVSCRDFGDATIDLAENSVGSSEQKCNIVKLTDTGPGAIRLDVSCVSTDREEDHREIVVLKKVDANTIFYRQTYKEKFKYPGARYSYCPEDAQRMYLEVKARDKAEAEQKAAEERSKAATRK